jgi:hypothetical protein
VRKKKEWRRETRKEKNGSNKQKKGRWEVKKEEKSSHIMLHYVAF